MIPCYAVYFWWLRLAKKERAANSLLLVLIFVGSVVGYESTDAFFHDHGFQPFRWKQMFSSFVKYVAFSAFFVAFYYLKKTIKQQQKIQAINKEKDNAELNAIKAQLTPHFLFNTLNSIYADALKVDHSLAKTILMLSDNTRYFLEQGRQMEVSLADEIAHIKNYLALQLHRLQDKIRIDYREDVENSRLTIAPLLLIPLVENAIKYTSMLSGNGHLISLHLSEQAGQFRLMCCNPRKVHTEEALNEQWRKSGIGLYSIKKRLALLYPNSHSLQIDAKPTLFKVNLTIQLC